MIFFSLKEGTVNRVYDVLKEVVPDVRTEAGERPKAMSFAVVMKYNILHQYLYQLVTALLMRDGRLCLN